MAVIIDISIPSLMSFGARDEVAGADEPAHNDGLWAFPMEGCCTLFLQ